MEIIFIILKTEWETGQKRHLVECKDSWARREKVKIDPNPTTDLATGPGKLIFRPGR